MELYFFNYRNRGDLHVSRSLVKHVVDSKLFDKCTYYHMNDLKILQDIEGMESKRVAWKYDKEDMRGYYYEDNKFFFNTWYKSHSHKLLTKYGITIQTLYHIFYATLKENFNYEISKDIVKFLPTIYFKYFDTSWIDDFTENDYRKKVLICNNLVESSQSKNFDFNPIIESLCNKFPDILFIVTNSFLPFIIKPNVKYVSHSIGPLFNNLNEIGYLSTFCDVMVGRMSGPHTFSFIDTNLLDPKKTFISFIYKHPLFGDASFGVTDLVQDPSKRAKFVLSDDFSFNGVKKTIEEVLYV